MNQFLLRWMINAVALVAATYAVDALVTGGYLGERIILRGVDAILLAALVFGFVNAVIKPLMGLVTCLVNLFTLGLFTFVVNALMLLLTSWVVAEVNRTVGLQLAFSVQGFWAALVGAIIISIVSTVLTKAIE